MIIFIIPKEYNLQFSVKKINILLNSTFKTNDFCFKYVPIKYINEYTKENSYHIFTNDKEQALADIVKIIKHHFMTIMFYISQDGSIKENNNFLKNSNLLMKTYKVFDNDIKAIGNVKGYIKNHYLRSIYLIHIDTYTTEKIYDNIVYFDSYDEAKKLQKLYAEYMISELNKQLIRLTNDLHKTENKLINFSNIISLGD